MPTRMTLTGQHRPTTVGRAYELARSGEFTSVEQIVKRLKAELHHDARSQLDGPTIREALRRLCLAAQVDGSPDPAVPECAANDDDATEQPLADEEAG